jgi:arylformamidase
MEHWIDISVPIQTGMMSWPDQPGVDVSKLMSIDKGDASNVSKLQLSVHTGTHMDAPLHFLPGGNDITTVPLEEVIGRTRVVEINDVESIKADDVRDIGLTKGHRILFKTANSKRRWDAAPFDPDFVYLSTDAARLLAEKQVSCVGIDYPSIAGYKKNEKPVHEILLTAGIWIIEGLYLADVSAGEFEMIALPLKIQGSDGSPARVVIKKV